MAAPAVADTGTLDLNGKLVILHTNDVHGRAVADMVNSLNAKVDEELSAVFAATVVDLNGERDPGVRTMETNLGGFACEALLWAAQQALGEEGAVAAITNGGGIRASIPTGEVSMKDMNIEKLCWKAWQSIDNPTRR